MKLSIITINYNNCEGLRKTIDSVINQTWQEFEWIIVDGGSTDGSRELVEETALLLASQGWKTEKFSLLGFTSEDWKNGGFTLPTYEKPSLSTSLNAAKLKWTSEKDKGIYNAMNKGIAVANGEYCLFLNSGDYLFENHVLVDAIHNGLNKDIVYGKVRVLYPKQYTTDIPESYLTIQYFLENTIPHQGAFISLSLFKKYGIYNENLTIISDWEFFIKCIILSKCSVKQINHIISVYVGGGISDNVEKTRQEKSIVIYNLLLPLIKKDYGMVESLKKVRKYRLFRLIYSIMYRLSCLLK